MRARLTVQTRWLGLSATAAALLAAITAHAQDTKPATATSPNDSGLSADQSDQIIVTATKRAQRLIDVPQSITAITGDQLRYRNQTRIEEFVQSVPGLSLQEGSVRQVKLILRGINSGGASANVGVVVDETPFSYQSGLTNGGYDTANLDTFDMERIEVLKGPQGTLYGAASESGLLKYVTVKPNLDKVEGTIEGFGECVEQGECGGGAKGALNLPIAAGKAAIRFAGFYDRVAGYVDDRLHGEKDANKGRRYGGRVSLLVKPLDNVTLRLTASDQEQHFDSNQFVEFVGSSEGGFAPPENAMQIANGGKLLFHTLFGDPSDNRYRYVNAVVDWDAGFADILSSSSYGNLSTKFRNDITFNEPVPGVTYQKAFAGLYGPNTGYWGKQENSADRYNEELRLTSKPTRLLGLGLDWQLGAFFAHEDITFNQFYDAINPATGSVITTPFPVGGSVLPGKYEEFSGFGSTTLHIAPRLDVIGGLRYADISQASHITNFPGLITDPTAKGPIVNPNITSHEGKVTWNASLRYKPTENTIAYFRAASGYRSGGPNLIIPGAPKDFPFTYKPDNLINYEIGYRSDLLHRQLTVDVAAYYIEWTDIQVLTQFISQTSGQIYNVTGNAGAAESKGVEWAVSLRPVKGITLSDSGAYTDAYLTSSAQQNAGLGVAAVPGAQLAFVPDWTNTVNADFETQLNSNVRAFGGATWAYVGRRFSDFGNTPQFKTHYTLPGYSQVNLQAGVDFGKYTASVYVRNLADERGITSFFYNYGYNNMGYGTVIQPRTVGIRLNAKF